MPGAELSNIKAKWSDGALVITDLDENPIITIYPSSGGISFANAGGLTISTGILGGLTISTGILGGLTVSSGITLDGEIARTVTTAATLAVGDYGRIAKCSVDGTFITLMSAASTALAGASITVMNTAAAAGAQVIVITATGDSIKGAGISTSNLLSNTKATAKKGDYVSLVSGASTTWFVSGMVGIWASTT